jgi:phage gp29-like protein
MKSSLVDQYGRPIIREGLMTEVAAATITGVRNPYMGDPANGLNPVRLASILRAAAQSDPLQYFELAETIEERDLHYAGVLGTRKRSVAQIDITIEAAGDDAEAEKHAQFIRDWLDRDELQDEIFDILDAVGKGISFTEIMWESSEGNFWPKKLEWRDPRFFTFSPEDWATPLLRNMEGNVPLPGYKFITGRIKAKSGLPIRSGIARLAAWAWMFKSYTQRDWAIFTQSYGQPIRVGKYGASATKDERDTLFRAVANIAGDCAAIMPDSMTIDFVEAKNVSGATDHYERRSNWFDMQISKGVLGQTTTTDAVSGGHAVSKEHRKVQEDIERADAKALSAVLNSDLFRPMIDLNFGPQKKYPRATIARPEAKDVAQIIDGVVKLVPMGMQVGQKAMQKLLSLSELEADDVALVAPSAAPPTGSNAPTDLLPSDKSNLASLTKGLFASFKPKSQKARKPDHIDQLIEQAAPAMDDATELLIAHIRLAAEDATSLEDLQNKLLTMVPGLPEAQLADAMGQALVLATLSGMEQAQKPPSTG